MAKKQKLEIKTLMSTVNTTAVAMNREPAQQMTEVLFPSTGPNLNVIDMDLEPLPMNVWKAQPHLHNDKIWNRNNFHSQQMQHMSEWEDTFLEPRYGPKNMNETLDMSDTNSPMMQEWEFMAMAR